MLFVQRLHASSDLVLTEKEFATKSCSASFLDTVTVSKNEVIHDFTGFQIHCAWHHSQNLKHVRVAFGGFFPSRMPTSTIVTTTTTTTTATTTTSTY